MVQHYPHLTKSADMNVSVHVGGPVETAGGAGILLLGFGNGQKTRLYLLIHKK